MKKILALLTLVMLTTVGCAPLLRGTSGDGLASTAKPDVLITVPSMPVVVSGAANPEIYTTVGYEAAQVWYQLNAPAGAANKVQTVIMIAETPTDWEWNLNVTPALEVADVRGAAFGGQTFEGATYLLPSDKDAFTQIVVQRDGSSPQMWLARRFTRLDNFRTIKLVLEYREAMPAMFANGLNTFNPDANAVLLAFANRAEKAFNVQFDRATVPLFNTKRDVPGVKTMNLVTLMGMMEPKNQPLSGFDK